MPARSLPAVLLLLLTLPLLASGAPAFTADPPVLLISAGQSADFQIVKVLLDRLRVPVAAKPMAKADDLKDVKTLLVVIGGSVKGLGAAGVDADEELARVNALLRRAEQGGVKILAMHIGGAARRGELSDRFIAAVVPQAGHLVIIKEGNEDGLFTRLSTQSKISMESVEKLAELDPVLRRIFRVK